VTKCVDVMTVTQTWNVHNIRQSVYVTERLERSIDTVHLAADVAVCSTRNDIGQISTPFLPRYMKCRLGLAMRILVVRLSVCQQAHCDKME